MFPTKCRYMMDRNSGSPTSFERTELPFWRQFMQMQKVENKICCSGCFPSFPCPQALAEQGLENPSLPWLCWEEQKEGFSVCAKATVLKKDISLHSPTPEAHVVRAARWGERWLGERTQGTVSPEADTSFPFSWRDISGTLLGILDWTFINEGTVSVRWPWRWELSWPWKNG